jgi:hypothetical protein
MRYIRNNKDGVLESEHRRVWSAMYGSIPADKHIDHIDGDTHNNRLENLRLVTRSENMKNSKRYVTNTSGVTGVVWDKSAGSYKVQLRHEGKRLYFGRYTDWFDAVCARMSANNTYGFHENHGRR